MARAARFPAAANRRGLANWLAPSHCLYNYEISTNIILNYETYKSSPTLTIYKQPITNGLLSL